jgi:hypothetical protein
MTRTNTNKALAGLLLTAAMLLIGLTSSASAAGPEISISLADGPGAYGGEHFYRGNTAVLNEDTVGAYRLHVTNTGDANTGETLHLTAELGPGLKLSKYPNSVIVLDGSSPFGAGAPCTGDGTPGNTLECEVSYYEGIRPGQTIEVVTSIAIANDAPDLSTTAMHLSGGGTVGTKTATNETPIVDLPPFEVKTFEGRTIEEDEEESTVAGGHPFESYNFFNFNYAESLAGENWRIPIEDMKNADATLPLGLFGNPAAAPRCPLKYITQFEFLDKCQPGSKVGRATLGWAAFRSTTWFPTKGTLRSSRSTSPTR